MSMTGYVDQLYAFDPLIHAEIDKRLLKWIGGPNGWINAHILGELKRSLGFMLAPRRHAINNIAARARVYKTLTNAGKAIIDEVTRHRRLQPHHSHLQFPNSVIYSLRSIKNVCHNMHVTIDNIVGDLVRRGQPLRNLQSVLYDIILEHWKWESDKSRAECTRGSILEILRKRCEKFYLIPQESSKERCEKWMKTSGLCANSCLLVWLHAY